MEVLTSKATRRSTRLRVEIPVGVISLDRQRPFGEKCMVLVVSAQGCGFRSSEELHVGTPIMMSELPGGGSVTGRVASCVPMGKDGFLVGVALYTHGNVWGIVDPPADWNAAAKDTPVSNPDGPAAAPTLKVNKKQWPYNLVSDGNEIHGTHR